MQTKKNNKGVSLVEVMVAIAIGSIVLAALSLLIVHSVNSYRNRPFYQISKMKLILQ